MQNGKPSFSVPAHDGHSTNSSFVIRSAGCICCTLRADLLEEVANLAEAGSFEYVILYLCGFPFSFEADTFSFRFNSYLIIESSGISEPIQVSYPHIPLSFQHDTNNSNTGRRNLHPRIRRIHRQRGRNRRN
jgi:hypothetical protein